MKNEAQPQHTQGELKAYPEGHRHSEEYPEPEANPYRVDIAVDGYAQRDGSGLVAKVYGKTEEQAKANAQRIVKAVNMYDGLVRGLKRALNDFSKSTWTEETYKSIEQLLKQAEQSQSK